MQAGAVYSTMQLTRFLAVALFFSRVFAANQLRFGELVCTIGARFVQEHVQPTCISMQVGPHSGAVLDLRGDTLNFCSRQIDASFVLLRREYPLLAPQDQGHLVLKQENETNVGRVQEGDIIVVILTLRPSYIPIQHFEALKGCRDANELAYVLRKEFHPSEDVYIAASIVQGWEPRDADLIVPEMGADAEMREETRIGERGQRHEREYGWEQGQELGNRGRKRGREQGQEMGPKRKRR